MPTLYRTTAPESTTWPEPLESAYQAQQRWRGPAVPGARRPDIARPMRLLIASVVDLGRERPHGMITWLADALDTTRETIYTIGATWSNREPPSPTMPETAGARRHAERNRLAQAALTLLVVGAMQLRSVQWCLAALLGNTRSIGWLCGLVDEAGGRAGAVLADADWSGAHRMIVSRDELFVGELAWLLTVDTDSLAIVSGHVETRVDSETWGVSLALDVLKTGDKLDGLAEDGAKWYPRSIARAEALLGAPFAPMIQKDVWHLTRQARQTVRDADRIALTRLAAAERKAKRLSPTFMVIHDANGYEAAHERSDRAIATADAIRAAVDLLPEALAIVDRRTNRVLDHDTAAWYLAAIAQHLIGTDSDLAEALAGTIKRQTAELLCFHGYLDGALGTWRERALAHFAEPELVDLFERDVARAWRLRRAVTNGRYPLKAVARKAAQHAQALCHGDPDAAGLAEDLDDLLDGTIRTSSASENVNSILRAYLWGRRYFPTRRTAQHWLNLLVLWHNMRVFERGKRAGKSPFQRAGVKVYAPDGRPTDDWLVALGYAAAA